MKSHSTLPSFTGGSRWVVLFILLFVIGFVVTQSFAIEIVAAEYFFDSDPGHGNGTALMISPSGSPLQDTTLAMNGDLDLSALDPGLHTFFLRLRDDQGHWSLSFAKLFYLVENMAQDSLAITEAEYFIDSDPGVGSATPVPLTAAQDPSFGVVLDVDSLGFSLHTFGTRVRDEFGNWSVTKSRKFLFVPLDNANTLEMVAAESFFDTDPGIGNGFPMSVTAGPEGVAVADLNVDGLSPGLHSCFVRVQDEYGHWSVTQTKLFMKIELEPSLALAGAEYFIDDDPGAGSGFPITLPEDGAWGDIEEIINDSVTAGLPITGSHSFNLRFQDSQGQWSEAASDSFRVFIRQDTIVAMEYFWDTDPGPGNGTAADIDFPGPSTRISHFLDLSALSVGPHRLYVRYLAWGGVWSAPSGWAVNVRPPLHMAAEAVIAESELYFDSLTAPGTGQDQFAEDGAFGESQETAVLNIPEVSFTPGQHYVFTRVRDAFGHWSPARKDSFTVDAPQTPPILVARAADNSDSVQLSWTTFPFATEYHVYFDSVSTGAFNDFVIVSAPDTTITLPLAAAQRFFIVRALTGAFSAQTVREPNPRAESSEP